MNILQNIREKRSSEVLKGDFPGSTVVKNQPSMQGTQV